MSEIATLGLRIDSSQAKTAATDLDRLQASAGNAATATEKLAAASGRSESQVRVIQSMAKRAGVSFEEMAARVDAASKGHLKLATSAGSAVQGLNALANAAAGSGNSGGAAGAADRTSNSFEKLANTLTRRLLFAFAAKEVKELAQYTWQLNAAIAATADTAARSNVANGQFQGLQTTAAYKGVSNDAFNAAMLGFNQQVDLAKRGLGDLNVLLISNGKTVGDTATTFGIVADLVKNASSEAAKFSILQQAGLPATREFAKLMEQGSQSINKQADAAAKLTDQQLADAKRIDEEWQRLWINFQNYGKRAAVGVAGAIREAVKSGFGGAGFDGLGPSPEEIARIAAINRLRKGDGSRLTDTSDVSGFYTGVVPNAPRTKTVNPADAKQLIAQAQPQLGLLGQLPTAKQAVKPNPEKDNRSDSDNLRRAA